MVLMNRFAVVCIFSTLLCTADASAVFPAQLGANRTSAAAEGAQARTARSDTALAGIYFQQTSGGSRLPSALPADPANVAFCEEGGELLDHSLFSGAIELTPRGQAHIRSTIQIVCKAEYQANLRYLPARTTGTYRQAGDTVTIRVKERTLVFRYDAAQGTLTGLGTNDGTWRKAPRALYSIEGRDNAPVVQTPRALLAAVMNANGIVLGSSDRGGVASTAQQPYWIADLLRAETVEGRPFIWIASLPVSRLDGPVAEIGDTVYATFGGTPRRVVAMAIRDRAKAIPQYGDQCGGLVSEPSWLYELAFVGPAPTPAVGDEAPVDGLVIPERWSLFTDRPSAPANTLALRAAYREELNRARTRVAHRYRGVPGYGNLDTPITAQELDNFLSMARPIPFRGPTGTLFLYVLSRFDDPSDHGGESYVTYMLDPSGRILLKHEGFFDVRLVADTDGDGVSELLTREGMIRWDGMRWRFPPPTPSLYCD